MTQRPQALDEPGGQERRSALTWLFVAIPLIAFAAIAMLCYQRLGVDTSAIPSPLIGKEPPAFALPVVDPNVPADRAGEAKFTNADLKKGGVTIVNFFGSYCEPCKREQGVLAQMAQDKGLAAKGVRVAGIDWGITGVPETYIVKGDGTIAYKYVGEMNDQIMAETILPQIEKAAAGRR